MQDIFSSCNNTFNAQRVLQISDILSLYYSTEFSDERSRAQAGIYHTEIVFIGSRNCIFDFYSCPLCTERYSIFVKNKQNSIYLEVL